MKRFCLIDFETASACDLKKAGAWVYGADPTTEILCLGATFNGAEPVVYSPEELHSGLCAFLRDDVLDPECVFVAHNVAFEKSIWRQIMMPVFHWPDIPDERWHDTQAVCAMKGLPLGLDQAARVMNLHAQKDTEGSRLTKGMSKANKKGYLDRSGEKLQRVMDYCRDDIQAELELHRAVKSLGAEERKVWLLDQTINQRGVRLDMDFVSAAQQIVDDTSGPLLREFHTITGNLKPASPKFVEWLHGKGCHIPNLQKETVNQWIGAFDAEDEDESLADTDEDYAQAHAEERLDPLCLRALQIRQVLGSASIKKLGAMRSCVGFDGRARGLLQYHGAGPGRWAGRLLQPQNFPRPTTKVSGSPADPGQLVDAIFSRDHRYVEMLFGNPVAAVASSLRHALIPSAGNLFSVGDFATVEARIVLALAGQHDKTALIASGQDIYIDMAQTIYHRPVDKKRDPELRQIGKNTVLGCGFQMGWAKFQSRYAPDEDEGFARRCIDAYRKDFAPMVPRLWYALEDAATRCVWDRTPQEAYGIVYRLEDGWLTCRLPSGRKLWYRDPQKDRKSMPWDHTDVRQAFRYKAWKLGQWKTVWAYGGLLTENVVQATARDMLVHSMFRCEENNLPLVLTVHDEAVTDAPGDNSKLLEQLMVEQPDWVRHLQVPVGAECWSGDRYRK